MCLCVHAGFDREIPGFPRYRMDGNVDLGESDLFINDAMLEDDGEYQCQVGPGDGDSPLQGVAQLIVLSEYRLSWQRVVMTMGCHASVMCGCH